MNFEWNSVRKAGHAFNTSNAWNRPRAGKGHQCLKPSHAKAYQQDTMDAAERSGAIMLGGLN